jgi:preprotein translocase subunit SecG
MQTLLVVFHMMLSVGLIALILIQHGKGADIGAAFGSGASATVFGARGSGSFLSRTTAILATLFFLTSMALAYFAAQVTAPKGVMDAVEPRQVEQPAAPESEVPLPPGAQVPTQIEVPVPQESPVPVVPEQSPSAVPAVPAESAAPTALEPTAPAEESAIPVAPTESASPVVPVESSGSEGTSPTENIEPVQEGSAGDSAAEGVSPSSAESPEADPREGTPQ